MITYIPKALFLLTITSILGGCSSLPDEKNIDTRAEQLATKSAKPSQSLLQQAKLKLHKADRELLAFYAPTYFEKATESYSKAKSLYEEHAKDYDIHLASQLSIQYVESGLRNKKIVQEYLADSLKNRTILKQLKADRLYPEAFKAITEQHLALIKQVEQREEMAAKNQQKPLIQAMKALEVKAVERTYLTETYAVIDQAKALLSDERLPSTFKQTMDQIHQIERYIANNPRNKDQIRKYTEDSLFAAQRLLSLAQVASKINSLTPESLEGWVLKQDAQFQKIAHAMKHEDISNLSPADQSLLLSQYASKLINQHKQAYKAIKQQKEMDKWKRKVVLLEAEIRRLKRQQN